MSKQNEGAEHNVAVSVTAIAEPSVSLTVTRSLVSAEKSYRELHKKLIREPDYIAERIIAEPQLAANWMPSFADMFPGDKFDPEIVKDVAASALKVKEHRRKLYLYVLPTVVTAVLGIIGVYLFGAN